MKMKNGYKAGGKAMKYQAGGMPMEGPTSGAPGVLDLEEIERKNTPRPMPPGAMNRMEGLTPEEKKKKKKKGMKKGMKSGGKVRGYGMARGGRACKMR